MTTATKTGRTTISLESVHQPEIEALIGLSDSYMNSLYPPEGNFAIDLKALDQPEIIFAVARLDGDIVGCCALKLETDGTAEIKRLFIDPSGRGHGLGRDLVRFLEAMAREKQVHTMNLETGPLNTEAVQLYKSAGYVVCSRFGSYPDNPYSLFMTKSLA